MPASWQKQAAFPTTRQGRGMPFASLSGKAARTIATSGEKQPLRLHRVPE